MKKKPENTLGNEYRRARNALSRFAHVDKPTKTAEKDASELSEMMDTFAAELKQKREAFTLLITKGEK